ncbi:stress enhanced protein 1, chloroplastic [Rhododendron vialii]|uniref:stress enhanced protein 1, chloroplastic n=1 Tax=Rhododendron vialii TaxID=182163 RepID=UPI00265FCBDE|nr:stress enhanced protein 1, chloroplastic [Rhododendron vialii]
MSVTQASSSLYTSIHGIFASRSAKIPGAITRRTVVNVARMGNSFATGSPLSMSRIAGQRKTACKATPFSIRCDLSTKDGNGLDVWLGRVAMIGFATAISVEIVTGKGLLENFGLTSPLPTVALGVTALVGVLTAIFIFQSASKG